MQIQGIRGEDRYELADLINAEELKRYIAAFANCTGLAGGVVRNPCANEKLPTNSRDWSEWLLTPVVYFKSDGTIAEGTDFCQLIRQSDAGTLACMKSDLTHAKQAFAQKKPIPYYCLPAQLRDHIAAISVGGHHLANVYLGQLRTPECKVSEAWKLFSEIMTDTRIPVDTSREEFETKYDQLPGSPTANTHITPERVVLDMVGALCDLIASRAARQGLVKVLREIGAEVGPGTTTDDGLWLFWRKVSRILNYSSGGIYLKEGQYLFPRAYSYPGNLGKGFRFNLEKEKGIVVRVARNGRPERFCTRSQMDDTVDTYVPGSRDQRSIQSLMACPLMSDDGRVIGVIEVGNNEENAFTADDLNLLESLGRFAAIFVRSERKKSLLQRITGEANLQILLRTIIGEIPEAIHGGGTSVFVREDRLQSRIAPDAERPHERKSTQDMSYWLVETSEFHDTDQLQYVRDEGLTGWVAKWCLPLRVPFGKGSREPEALREAISEYTVANPYLPTPKWIGKGSKMPGAKSKEYYRDKAFMAVPILDVAGDCLGIIRIGESDRSFGKADEYFLSACASAIASCMERVRLKETLDTIQRANFRIPNVVNRSLRAYEELQGRFLRRFCRWGLVPTGILVMGAAALTGYMSASMTPAVLVFILGGAWLILLGLWIFPRVTKIR